MGAKNTKSLFWELKDLCLRCYPWSAWSFSPLASKQGLWFLLLITALLFSGCKTVPVLDRNFADKGGLWEQDANTGARFHHNAMADEASIGRMKASGRSALINGSQVKQSAQVKNNSFVITGPQSGARIEFKASEASCLIRVDEFNIGNAYVDTATCQQSIKTPHALIEAKSAILHIQVSQYETEVMVISGMVKVVLRENPMQSIDVKADREIIITHQSIGDPRLMTTEEIWQRIRWREGFQLYETVIDWKKVMAGVITVGIIAAAILLSKGHGHGGRGVGFPRHR